MIQLQANGRRLQAGDVVCVKNTGLEGGLINVAQWFWSRDNESKYNHSLIITDDHGATIESTMPKVKEQNIFTAYAGRPVLVARFDAPLEFKLDGIKLIRRQYLGHMYPVWRIPLHLAWPLSKFVTAGGRYLVCSELVAKYLLYCGVRPGPYTGVNPDTLADEWRRWKKFTIVFEGALPTGCGGHAQQQDGRE